MTTQHTPGPWHAQRLDEESGAWFVPEPLVVWSSDGDLLNEANARLIAAAPALLAALEAYQANNPIHNDSESELYAQAEAAIKLAKEGAA